jgi:hypothetical protein
MRSLFYEARVPGENKILEMVARGSARAHRAEEETLKFTDVSRPCKLIDTIIHSRAISARAIRNEARRSR